MSAPGQPGFYDRSLHDLARELLGCTLRHGATAGRIVEVESYHQDEPACHAYAGLTARTRTLFGAPGRAYVYRSYGIHALFNVVAEPEGVGAAVLIRALEPLVGIEAMQRRRGAPRAASDLCSGPGKLTQALAIGLELDGSALDGAPLAIEPPPAGARAARPVTGTRIGITKAVELPWRLCDATSDCVSRPWPAEMRAPAARRGRVRSAA